MAASSGFSDDFTQYLADTARELAETGRRTERTIERMSVIAAAIQRDSKLATEALHAVASGLRDISSGLRDFTETSHGATDRATEALIEACEQSKEDMRRLTELSDMLAAYLSVPGDGDAAPGQEESG